MFDALITGEFVAEPKVSATLLVPELVAAAVVRVGVAAMALKVLVVAGVTVGELAEVVIPAASKVAVTLSRGLIVPLHELPVDITTKNVPPLASELFTEVVIVVVEPMLTVVWVPATRSVNGSKILLLLVSL